MPFLNHLITESVRGRNTRRVRNEFIYRDQQHGLIIVPFDFETDYASIPSIVPRWFIDESDYFIREAAVVHDYLYDSKGLNYQITREQADQVLYRAMRESGSSWMKAQIVYRAVRCFGGGHWH